MNWDSYYDWRGVFEISGWIKGIAIAFWLPALAAAAASYSLKTGIYWRLHVVVFYLLVSAGWSSILLLMPMTGNWSPSWHDTATWTTVPFTLAGLVIVVLTRSPAFGGRRGFDVIT